MTDSRRDEFDAFLAEAKALGMPGEIRPEDVGVRLPSAQEMLVRAQAAEVAARGSAATARQTWSSTTRLTLAIAAGIAIMFGAFAVDLSSKRSATAAAPPILDFEFVKARNIAWAPGRDASPELRRLARTAGKWVGPQGTGTTQYLVSENWFADTSVSTKRGSVALAPIRREFWLHSDGSFTSRESEGEALRPDGRHDLEQPRSRSRDASIQSEPSGSLDANAVGSLGTDPAKVRSTLLQRSECVSFEQSSTRAACLFGEISSLAQTNVIPARTLRAFWLILADEPSIRNLGTVRDREGRPGVGISLIAPDYKQLRRILIVSSSTGEVLGKEDILIKSDPTLDLRAPAIMEFSAIVSSRWTSEPGPRELSRK